MVVLGAVLVSCSTEDGRTDDGNPVDDPPRVDDYGDDPTVLAGERDDICRNGEAANRAGRAELTAFIEQQWPQVEDVLGYECREITDPTLDGCDGEVEPERSNCWSTHAAGRAIDVVVGGQPNLPTPEGVALGDMIATAFLAERGGVAHYLARVTGIQEIIWNDRCWHPEDADVISAADMKACSIRGHDNHVHLTLSEDGADGLTSWYERR